jgi:flagellar biosynthesis protein FliQ
MSDELVLDIARQALFVLITAGAPVMLVALLVGLVVSLFQALTQIQEMTLSFVPKIVAIFLTLILALPFMLSTLSGFALELYGRIGTLD